MRATEIMEHLIRFVDDPAEVAVMTQDEVKAALAGEGVDLDALKARLDTRLAAIRAELSVSQEEPADAGE